MDSAPALFGTTADVQVPLEILGCFFILQGPLKDAVTMKSYITYFSAHKTEFCGKIVLDVGCKLGLMSLICAGLGAKTVFAMDSSPFSSITMAVALDSGFPST